MIPRFFGRFILVCCLVSCAKKTAPPAPGTAGKIGDRVAFEDSEWTVVEAKNVGQKIAQNGGPGAPRTTEGKFIQIHYRVTNLGKKEERLLDAPRVVDAKGRQFGRIELEAFYVPERSAAIGVDPIEPRQGKEFWTVIEVPLDATGLELELHGLGLFGPKKLVDLGM
ncbi:MAG: hypothetical protein ABIP39_02050 [Polyangiaceae bacterium]